MDQNLNEDALMNAWRKTIEFDDMPEFEELDPQMSYRPQQSLTDQSQTMAVPAESLPTLIIDGVLPAELDSAQPQEQDALPSQYDFDGDVSNNQTVPLSHEQALGDSPKNPVQGYELLEEIGRGGMGIVFRATQGNLNRAVAVKTLRPRLMDVKTQRRFVSEAQITGRLDHPNIVPIHDLGIGPEGHLLMSMKLVDGMSWKDLLHPENDAHRARSKTMELDDHLSVLMNVCHAMNFAHSRGIVHNDLKPENIMIGHFGEVLVMDWGLAIDINNEANRPKGVQGPFGTPAYMAPELAAGELGKIGTWTDVYLLGAILCELIRGQPPHTGKKFTRVLMSALKSEPIDFAPELPSELVEICHKATLRETDERTQTVMEFQSQLKDFLSHKESLTITQNAWSLVKHQAEDPYSKLAEAVAAFQQALLLWPQNQDANRGQKQARLDYAKQAIDKGDFGLVQAQLNKVPDSDSEFKAHKEQLQSRLQKLEQRKAADERQQRRQRWLLRGLLVVIFLGLSVGLALLKRERDRAKTHAQNAERQAEIAEQEKQAADAARTQALKSAELARKAQTEAQQQARMMRERLSESLQVQGDLLGLNQRWRGARQLYRQAGQLLTDLKKSTFPVQLSLWKSYQISPPPVFQGPKLRHAIHDLALDPTGRFVMTCYRVRGADVWEYPSLKHVCSLPSRSKINCAVFNMTGDRVIAGHEDGTFTVCSLPEGRQVMKKKVAETPINALALSPDSLTLLIGSNDKDILCWSLRFHRRVTRFRGHRRGTKALAFSPDGVTAASGGEDFDIHLIDLANLRIRQFIPTQAWTSCLSFGPLGDLLVSGDHANRVVLWDVQTGSSKRVYQSHTDLVTAVRISREGDRLVSSSKDGQVHIRSWQYGALEKCLVTGDEPIRCLDLASDNQTLAAGVGLFEGRITVWNLNEEPGALSLKNNHLNGVEVQFSPSGQRIVTWGSRVQARHLLSGRVLRDFGSVPSVRAAQFTDEDHILIASREGLKKYSLATGEAVQDFTDKAVREFAYHPKTGNLAWRERSQAVLLWDNAKKQSKPLLAADKKRSIRRLFWSDDGELLLAAVDKGAWAINKEGSVLRKFAGVSKGIDEIRLLKTGALVAAGWAYGVIDVYEWNFQSGELLGTQVLKSHTKHVQDLCFSPDGQVLLSGSLDQRVLVWNWRQKRVLKAFADHQSAISHCSFSPNGRTIISSDRAGKLRLRRLDYHTDIKSRQEILEAAMKALQKRPDSQADLTQVARSFAQAGLNDWALKFWRRAQKRQQKLTYDPQMAALFWRLGHDEQALAMYSQSDRGLIKAALKRQVQDAKDKQLLGRLQHGSLRTFIGPDLFDQDRALVFSGGSFGWMECFDLNTQKRLWRLRGHRRNIDSVALSGRALLAFTGGRDGTVRTWFVPSGRCLRIDRYHQQPVRALAANPTATVLASAADRSKKIYLHDGLFGNRLHVLEGHSSSIHDLDVSANGKHVVSISHDRSARVWSLTGESAESKVLESGERTLYRIKYVEDLGVLVAGRGGVRIYKQSGQKLLELPIKGAARVHDMAVSRDLRRVLVLSSDKHLRGWSYPEGEALFDRKLEVKGVGHDMVLVNQDRQILLRTSSGHLQRFSAEP